MRFILDFVYLLAVILLSPLLIYRSLTTGKYRRGMIGKMLGRVAIPKKTRPRAWFHGVSVGEIHMLRHLVAAFRQRHPDWECVVSTTTDTGFDEAKKAFADLAVFFFPLDFSWAVRRTIRTVDPDLIILGEGELWPNFLLAARTNHKRVVVVNGRLSPRSAARHRRFRWLTRPLWKCIDRFAVQTEDYAENYRGLGIPAEKVVVTGNVKYDGARMDPHHESVERMRELLAVGAGDLVWVCGSTQAPEEEIALHIFDRLRPQFPTLRLVLVPRQRDRFDVVAALLDNKGVPFVRRSALRSALCAPRSAVVLMDTIGELGALWGLADVAFVGGSMDGRRGGQNMIEPAAYGSAVLFGPHVWNFRDAATRLVAAGGAIQVQDELELEAAVRALLVDAGRQRDMGQAARQFVRSQQGATARTMAAIDDMLNVSQPLAA